MLNGETARTEADEAFLYRELRALIAGVVAKEPGGIYGIGTGANLTHVVHEAWVRLQSTNRWSSRAHFFGAASNAARQVLIDDARRRRARGPHQGLLEDPPARPTSDFVLEIDEVLLRLGATDPRAARVAGLKLFGDLDTQVIADILGVSTKTVQRDWSFARGFLGVELRPDSSARSGGRPAD